MALEDGLLLGILFSEHSLSPAATLRLYEQLRLPRTSRVQFGSRDRAKENHLRSPGDRLIRNAKFKWRQLTDPHALLQRAEWIYGYHPRELDLIALPRSIQSALRSPTRSPKIAQALDASTAVYRVDTPGLVARFVTQEVHD